MIHPFMPDLAEKTLDQLQETITDLMGKLNFAYRTSNRALIDQLNMVLEGYKAEHARRMDALFKKQNIQTTISVEKDKP